MSISNLLSNAARDAFLLSPHLRLLCMSYMSAFPAAAYQCYRN